MNFLLILVAFVVEFHVRGCEDLRSRRWSEAWLARLTRAAGGYRWWRGPGGAVLVIVPPVAAAVVAFGLLGAVSAGLADLAGLGVLLLMIGPRDLDRDVDAHNRASSGAAPATAPARHPEFLALAAGLPLGAPAGDERIEESREEMAGLALAADSAWYQPLFWFLVLGPIGAVLYRLSANLCFARDIDDDLARALEQVHEALEWLPARVTVLAFALAGTFVPVLETARAVGLLRWGSSAELVARTALAAVDNGRINDAIVGDPDVYRMNAMHALVKRALHLWLVFLAALALIIV